MMALENERFHSRLCFYYSNFLIKLFKINQVMESLSLLHSNFVKLYRLISVYSRILKLGGNISFWRK